MENYSYTFACLVLRHKAHMILPSRAANPMVLSEHRVPKNVMDRSSCSSFSHILSGLAPCSRVQGPENCRMF